MGFATFRFPGANDLSLAASVYGAPAAGESSAQPVMLLHGGGQTRHSFHKTALKLAAAGFIAITIDQRGHGDSDRSVDEAYDYSDFAADASAVASDIAQKYGRRPVSIGASLGGNASLMACKTGELPPIAGLVLVDVTPRMEPTGLAAVHGFMSQHSEEGFATVEDASNAIAAYLPHRPKPRSLSGLAKNLRQRNGRFFWHWDPAFFVGKRPISDNREAVEAILLEAARHLRIPTLLVRGRSSELVSEALAREFLDLVPHAEYVDIRGARHMVAGDDNDEFSAAILSFLMARFSTPDASG